jgi:predicted Zn-dependent peptidase
MLVARFEIVSDWKEIQEYLPSIRAVTSADIQRVAKRYFAEENRTAGMLIPLTETGPDAAPEEPKQDGEGGENR